MKYECNPDEGQIVRGWVVTLCPRCGELARYMAIGVCGNCDGVDEYAQEELLDEGK